MKDIDQRIRDILSARTSKKAKERDLLRLIADDRRDFMLAYLRIPENKKPRWVEKV